MSPDSTKTAATIPMAPLAWRRGERYPLDGPAALTDLYQAYQVTVLFGTCRLAYQGDRKLHVTSSLNPVTGMESHADANFSARNFGVKTKQCATSASKLSPESIDRLVAAAQEQSNLARWVVGKRPLPMNGQYDFDFAELVEE